MGADCVARTASLVWPNAISKVMRFERWPSRTATGRMRGIVHRVMLLFGWTSHLWMRMDALPYRVLSVQKMDPYSSVQ